MWRAVNDQEVSALMARAAKQMHTLVFRQGLNLDQARELVQEELLPAPIRTQTNGAGLKPHPSASSVPADDDEIFLSSGTLATGTPLTSTTCDAAAGSAGVGADSPIVCARACASTSSIIPSI